MPAVEMAGGDGIARLGAAGCGAPVAVGGDATAEERDEETVALVRACATGGVAACRAGRLVATCGEAGGGAAIAGAETTMARGTTVALGERTETAAAAATGDGETGEFEGLAAGGGAGGAGRTTGAARRRCVSA